MPQVEHLRIKPSCKFPAALLLYKCCLDVQSTVPACSAQSAGDPSWFGGKIPQVSRILQFNRQLEALKGDGGLVPGVGRTSVWGGKYDSASGEGKSRDLRDLFKVYIEERLRRDGEITEVRCHPHRCRANGSSWSAATQQGRTLYCFCTFLRAASLSKLEIHSPSGGTQCMIVKGRTVATNPMLNTPLH